MRLELAERLRCPRPHRPTPLVVVAAKVVERDLRTGVAGCSLCQFEARVVDGDLWLDAALAPDDPIDGAEVPMDATVASRDGELDRLVAQLGLVEPGGAVLVSGRYAAFADALAARCDVAVIVVGGARQRAEPTSDVDGPVATVHGVGDALPFADATFRAAAVADGFARMLLADVVRVVAVGGRIVAARSLPVPDGVRELAVDDREWVGEREPPSLVVTLGRRTVD